MRTQAPSDGYTYVLRYAKDPGSQSCATRSGPERPIEMQPRIPELVDLQGVSFLIYPAAVMYEL
jgi:hypothetical protein